jgi:glycosyltransferase involved in cell wall biosynthesis
MFNEAPYVQRCLSATLEALAEVTDDFEVVVVDDASTDDTANQVKAFAARHASVRLVQNPHNLTLGGTLRHGFQVARKDLVLYTDADLPFDLGLVKKAVRLLRFQDADLVSAYRFQRVAEGLLRTLQSFAYNAMVRLLLRVPVRDVNFSFKVFRRALLPTLDLKSDGSFIDAELVAKIHHSGHRIIQFGVDYFPRSYGVSTLSSLKVVRKILVEFFRLRSEILSLRHRRVRVRKPDRDATRIAGAAATEWDSRRA